MSDLFHFLKELLRTEPEVIAAFIMGVVVATVFLSSLLYWFFSRYYSRKAKEAAAEIDELRTKLKDGKEERAELKIQHEHEIRKCFEQLETQRQKSEMELRDRDVQTRRLERTHQKLLGDAAARYKKLRHKAVKELAWRIKRLEAVDIQVQRVEELQGKFWEAPVRVEVPAFRPRSARRARIIAVTNLKGGVGKTTLTANLAATYAAMGKQVLMIDLDFQASLTYACLRLEQIQEIDRNGGQWIQDVFQSSADPLRAATHGLTRIDGQGLHLLGAREQLFDVEEQAKAQWLLNLAGPDVRCILRGVLHDPSFADRFDLILLDCPPRWTPASINALTSCDYVLVPVLLDKVSADAVPRLLKWLHNLKSSQIYEEMNVLGVVGNRAFPRAKLIAKEQEIWKALPQRCADAWKHPVHHFTPVIRNKGEFAQAAENHQFAAMYPELREIFDDLVNEMDQQRNRYESR